MGTVQHAYRLIVLHAQPFAEGGGGGVQFAAVYNIGSLMLAPHLWQRRPAPVLSTFSEVRLQWKPVDFGPSSDIAQVTHTISKNLEARSPGRSAGKLHCPRVAGSPPRALVPSR